MRIVSYNVNGLRPRLLAPPRTLSAFLDSLDADIICLQETKVIRQDLTADIAVADGYESFFSCNRILKKHRIGYSGVATFCRLGVEPCSTSPILPLAADEGLTGLLHRPQTGDIDGGKGRVGCYEEVFQTDMSMQELFQLDSEGRCLITDHGSFVLFNLYCPSVDPEDTERVKFKLDFFKTLQRRWEAFLKQNRRIIAVGDFNVSPFPIDSRAPGPDFDKNIFRKWFRSLLKNEGGPFQDVFRFFHPQRKEAYTCWSQSSGAEEFNYGSRIDLVLTAGSCKHEMTPQTTFDDTSHGFVECEVRDCDILTQFRRMRPDTHPRWEGGRSLKLEGSDHAPIVLLLKDQPPIRPHEAPPLAARFMPEIRGRQQKLVALLNNPPSSTGQSNSTKYDIMVGKGKKMQRTSTSSFNGKKQDVKRVQKPDSQQKDLRAFFVSSSQAQISVAEKRSYSEAASQSSISEGLTTWGIASGSEQRLTESRDTIDIAERRAELKLTNDDLERSTPDPHIRGSQEREVESGSISGSQEQCDSWNQIHTNGRMSGEIDIENLTQVEQIRADDDAKLNPSVAWSKIKEKMARAVPLCKGHDEPCAARVVKKPGPNIGRGFYVCPRPEGPSSNPEANCGHFEWASSFKKRGKPLSQSHALKPRTFFKRIS